MQRLALYTTIYPAVEAYLPDWYRSVRQQTDHDFQLWIGLDGIEARAVEAAIGEHVEALWVRPQSQSTPAEVRQRALAEIAENCDAVVLVDSDDILLSTRVEAAREALNRSDLNACALQLVDQKRRDLGTTFALPEHLLPENMLPRYNVFGFSNSCYRSDLLRRCLPLPKDAVLCDWFLATRAWLLGAQLSFDSAVRMEYRQYGANTAPVRFPYDANQVRRDTENVVQHFRLLLTSPLERAQPDRWAQVRELAADVELFCKRVVSDAARLEAYVLELNRLKPQVVWWWDVAHPALQWMWKDQVGVSHETSET